MTALSVERPAGRWSSLSDRLNPILVREVQQAVKGRLFVLTVLLVLLLSVVVATGVVGDGGADQRAGRNVFDAGLTLLVPLLLFVVPMGAYQSMRLELRSGIVEQLLLSRLRPRSIVSGKLLAAMVQFLLYVSILAPLLATSYLLRGVDLPTIVVSLVFALVFCVAATAAAISAAAQGVTPAMQSVAQVVAAFGFGMLTFGLMGFVGSGEYTRDLGWLMRRAEFSMVMSGIVLGCGVGATLSALTAQSFLLHAFENRATGFRLFLFAMPPLALAWLWLFVDARHWDDALHPLVFFATLLGIAFGVFMWTEQKELSPRVRAHVPRRAALALLAAPFLPGRDRGVACLLLYLGLVVGLAALALPGGPTRVVAPGVTITDWGRGFTRMTLFAAAFGVIYLSLAKLVRGRLPASVFGNHLARFLLPLLLLAFLLAPMLIDVFTRGGVDGWHLGHVMNPFWTIEQFAFHPERGPMLSLVLGMAAVCIVLQLRSLVVGVREVLAASAQRRSHAATPTQAEHA
ncbi:MAG: hypothetical protein JNM25_06765 [Planctomycetes bacterium]|nr:hypothetical protein [Planctomycetota bacterium]